MCTAITLQSAQGETFFGRTMDFSYDIDSHLFVLPRNLVWESSYNGQRMHNLYAIIGAGQQEGPLMALFDGVNEHGFAAASLYFAGYAEYEARPTPGKQPVPALQFLYYILGRCRSVEELKELLPQLSIVGVSDPVTNSVAPLHWIATDKSGKSVVVERTAQGTRLYENPIGVMANSPEFPWHLTNLRTYVQAQPQQADKSQWGNVTLKPFGQGAGTSALPGGFTSPERFVRAAYFKTHLPTPKSRESAVTSCFHVLDNVSIPKGAVVSNRGTYDYTRYTMFLNTHTCECWFKTYDNPQITVVGLWDHYKNSDSPIDLGSLDRPLEFDQITNKADETNRGG